MQEFELIRRYFTFSCPEGVPLPSSPVALGVGDDCALLDLPAGEQLAVTTDTLVSGVHFPVDGDPRLVGRRALRVNLSDLAAMGATPLGFQLALTLPALDERWLQGFSEGLAVDARGFSCPLLGGDTTRGPLAITITMLGTVAPDRVLRRNGARAGDIICVSGALGDAAAALDGLASRTAEDVLGRRYWLPEPRLALGRVLAEKASAGLDISDGLLQDVGHIARACGLTAVVESARVPVSPAVLHQLGDARGLYLALGGGDDYEICFTASEESLAVIERQAQGLDCAITRVGRMEPSAGRAPVVCLDGNGQPMAVTRAGYDHFPD